MNPFEVFTTERDQSPETARQSGKDRRALLTNSCGILIIIMIMINIGIHSSLFWVRYPAIRSFWYISQEIMIVSGKNGAHLDQEFCGRQEWLTDGRSIIPLFLMIMIHTSMTTLWYRWSTLMFPPGLYRRTSRQIRSCVIQTLEICRSWSASVWSLKYVFDWRRR